MPAPTGPSTMPTIEEYEEAFGDYTPSASESKNMSYMGNGVQTIAKKDLTKFMKLIEKGVFGDVKTGITAPGYYDNIIYNHRKQAMGYTQNEDDYLDKMFRIGDCFFIIPPEHISVSTITSNDSIQGIRHSGSVQTNHGYYQKEIQVNITLNGLNQINGYKVDSPFDYPYYIDGLRSLIAQFKTSPFLPVENALINIVHGVHAVALRNLTVETVSGFPETLMVSIVMQEANMKAYVFEDEVFFGDMFYWDLYRYYTQQPLRSGHKKYLSMITTPTLTNKFSFSVLKDDALGGYLRDEYGNLITDEDGEAIHLSESADYYEDSILIDLTDESNFEEVLSSKENVSLTALNFSMSNIMPAIQMSAHETPVFQFLGSSDTSFYMSFETTDNSVVTKFNEMNDRNQSIVRENIEKSGIGFLKIDNELVNLTGTSCLMISDISIVTVPGFPGLYNISLTCVSYDANQKETEKLVAMKPFKEGVNGGMGDLISHEAHGMANKFLQDEVIEDKLMDYDFYPDLCLPTIKEINEVVIPKIKEYRVKHGLLEAFPLDKISALDNGKGGVYTKDPKYVDPDFYMCYISKLSDIGNTEKSVMKQEDFVKDKETQGALNFDFSSITEATIGSYLEEAGDNPLDLFPELTPKPDVVNPPKYSYGYEPALQNEFEITPYWNYSSGYGANFGGSFADMDSESPNSNIFPPVSVLKKYGIPYIDLMCDRADAKCGYALGAAGEVYAPNSSEADAMSSSTGFFYYNQIPETTKWYGKQVFDCSGFLWWCLRQCGIGGASRIHSSQFKHYGTQISASELRLGDIFYNNGHCGAYLGDEKTVEAMNSNRGVTYGTINRTDYYYVRIDNLEQKMNEHLAKKPNFYIKSYTQEEIDQLQGENAADLGIIYEPIGSNNRAINTSSIINDVGENIDTSATTREPYIPGYLPPDPVTGWGGGSPIHPNLGKFPNNHEGVLCNDWDAEIYKHASTNKIDPNIVKAMMCVESRGRWDVVNTTNPDIYGLMQISRRWHNHRFIERFSVSIDQATPAQNIQIGCEIIKEYGTIADFDMEGTIIIYNAGEPHYNKVKAGQAALFNEPRKYIVNYRKFYSDLIRNGGRPGGAQTLTDTERFVANDMPGSALTGNTNLHTPPAGETFYIEHYNPTYGQTFGDKVGTIDLDLIGKPNVQFISKYSSNNNGEYVFDSSEMASVMKKINADSLVEYMFHDMYHYSSKGRLVRAFPSFLFMVIDEQSDWIDKKKLWSNYYIYRSIVDIDIHQAYDNPAATLKATLTNFNNNMAKLSSRKTTGELLDEGFIKFVYNLTGAIINEEISQEMLDIKNSLRDEIFLYEGARLHVRLGYGSNARKYPTSFNGLITNIEHGQTISLVAQSDGVELLNQPLTEKVAKTNKNIGLHAEVSNMIAEIFVKRESQFLYSFSMGNMKLNSRYGIEHFGLYYDAMNFVNDTEESSNAPEEHEGDEYDESAYSVGDATFLERQYDIVKNIYKGTYSGVPFSAGQFLGFDGEQNWRFFASGLVPWDAIKVTEKAMPDFIGYPRYHGFESRIFYGLPSWLYAYKYAIKDDNKDLYQFSKAFTQIHDVVSLDSIIENKITLDTSNLFTNAVGVYTLGGDLATTPVIMSDDKIDWGRQKTKTIDTLSVQDFAFIPSIVDKLLSWSGTIDNGKELAIRICISELINSWRETYSGELLLLGQSEINPYDWICMDDSLLHMNGSIMVRETIQSLSVSNGFTTTIVPGMHAFNTTKQSGLTNVMRSVRAVTSFIAHAKGIRFMANKMVKKAITSIATSKLYIFSKGVTMKVAGFISVHAKSLYSSVKKANCLTKVAAFMTKVDKLTDVVKGVKFLKTAKGAIMGLFKTSLFTPLGAVAVISWVVTQLLLGWFITWINDMFAYRNCIVLDPMFITMPNGEVKAYVGNVTGGETILQLDNIDTTGGV